MDAATRSISQWPPAPMMPPISKPCTSAVLPMLEGFRPQLLLVSAGFDAHRDDPLADINLTEDGFYQMTRLLVEVANRHCHGRLLSILEGGYNLRALGRSVIQHLLALSQP